MFYLVIAALPSPLIFKNEPEICNTKCHKKEPIGYGAIYHKCCTHIAKKKGGVGLKSFDITFYHQQANFS